MTQALQDGATFFCAAMLILYVNQRLNRFEYVVRREQERMVDLLRRIKPDPEPQPPPPPPEPEVAEERAPLPAAWLHKQT